MGFRYKKLIIKNNALVVGGAMKVKPILKDDGNFIKLTEFIKADNEKQELHTILVLFNKFDSQGMILDDEDVRDEAMVDFLKDGNKSLKILHETDKETEDSYIDAHLQSLDVVEETDKYFPELEGSIKAVYKIYDKEDWEIIKTLQLQTSIEGFGSLEEVEEEITKSKLKNFIKKYADAFKEYYGKDIIEEITKGDEMNAKELKAELDSIKQAIEKLDKGELVFKEESDIIDFAYNELEKVSKNLTEENKEMFFRFVELLKDFKSEKDEIVAEVKKSLNIGIDANLKEENESLKKEIEKLKKEFAEQITPLGDDNKITPDMVEVK